MKWAGRLTSKTSRWKKLLLGAATLPLDFLVGSAVIFLELLGRLLRLVRPRHAPLLAPRDTTRCSIVIVTWEGKELLAESLPALLQAVCFSGGDHEIIVVDNGSTDGSEHFVRSQFPEVRLVRSERNLYFGGGNNLGIKQAKNDIVVLLNNDMIVHEDFLAPLLRPFAAADVFAVGSQVFLADPLKRREETGKTSVGFNGSDLDWRHEAILPADERKGYVPILWAHGGAAAIDRQKFLWLGGFDRLFDPFYVEDADISYSAWKVGWRCLLAISSKVIHKHRSSTSKFGGEFITRIVHRNQYLFFWKQFTDLDKLWAHFGLAFRGRMRRAGVTGISLESRAFLGAAKRLPLVLLRRLQIASYVKRKDQEILDTVTSSVDGGALSSRIVFAESSFENQLGSGWFDAPRATSSNYGYMGKRASAFLKAPASSAEIRVKGFVPDGSSRDAEPLTLTIRCFGDQKKFEIKGSFDCTWEIELLPANLPVEVELSVNDTGALSPTRPTLALESIGFGQEEKKGRFPGTFKARTLAWHNTQNVSNDRPYRVLMITPYLPSRGVHGGANMMFNLIRTLSCRNRVTVLSFFENDSELTRAPDLAQYCEHLELVRRRQNFTDRNLFGVRPPEIVYEFNHRLMEDHVRRYLSSYSYDLMQCEFLQTAHFAKLDPRIPAILTNHEVLSLAYGKRFFALRWADRGRFSARIAWLRMLRYEQRILKRFAGAVVLTETEADFLGCILPALKVFRHGMGVDCDYFAPLQMPMQEQAAVFVGNFRHRPNVSAALWLLRDIWPRILQQIPDARLYIVGGSPDAEMKQYETAKNVTMTGLVEDVRPYLAKATVALAPVFEGGGMRTKVLEAWAMQKPVVGTALAFEGLSDGTADFGLVADDAPQFAQSVCNLLRDSESASRRGQQARIHVESQFSWQAFADFYERVYASVLGHHAAAHSGQNRRQEQAAVENSEAMRER